MQARREASILAKRVVKKNILIQKLFGRGTVVEKVLRTGTNVSVYYVSLYTSNSLNSQNTRFPIMIHSSKSQPTSTMLSERTLTPKLGII